MPTSGGADVSTDTIWSGCGSSAANEKRCGAIATNATAHTKTAMTRRITTTLPSRACDDPQTVDVEERGGKLDAVVVQTLGEMRAQAGRRHGAGEAAVVIDARLVVEDEQVGEA